MEIVHAHCGDLDEIMAVYDRARAFMRAGGNFSQWINGYPQRELIAGDIERGNLYVCLHEGKIAGVFAFIIGEDPTYLVIEGGSWRSSEGYGTIHRLGSSGIIGGVARACFDYCKSVIGHLRVDTHEDNLFMQKTVENNGFHKQGIIYLEDGSPRLAYDWLRE